MGGGDCLKRRELGQFVDLRGAWQEYEGPKYTSMTSDFNRTCHNEACPKKIKGLKISDMFQCVSICTNSGIIPNILSSYRFYMEN